MMASGTDHSVAIPVDGLDAVIFDTDGVVTDTATVHAAAWKRLFDEYLKGRGTREGKPWETFDPDTDYRRYVDGKPRYDGVRSFLQSRGITLPEGDPSDSETAKTNTSWSRSSEEVCVPFPLRWRWSVSSMSSASAPPSSRRAATWSRCSPPRG